MTGLASPSQLRMSFLRYALVTVPAVVLLGTLSGALSGAGFDNGWFAALDKPANLPPGWAFGAAWTLLYVLLGLSFAMVLHARGARGRERALILLGLLFLLALAWPPVFFAFHKVAPALSVVAAMIVCTVAGIFILWRIRIVAALLLFPWLGWLMFAATLNFQIVSLNPDAETLAPAGASTDIAL
jgi:tryptophan-rich sensory protein